MRSIVLAAAVLIAALPALAQEAGLRGMEIVGYRATVVMLAQQKCGGETRHDIRAQTDLRDVDFRFGMARAISDWSGRLADDTAAACAALRAMYGPNGTTAAGAWLAPR